MSDIPRDGQGRVRRPKPSQLLSDVMEALGPDHITTRTLMAALIERDVGAGVEPRAVTPLYGWHIPVLSDVPNVPYDLQELALDVEGTDTGWRNITSLLINGWAAQTSILVRRTGRLVQLQISGAYHTAGATTAPITTAPTGFAVKSGVTNPIVCRDYYGASTVDYLLLSPSPWIGGPMAAAAARRYYGQITYFTDAAWPTTLPGTPG